MRLQSAKKVKVRSTTIGGQNPLVCLPIVAKDMGELNDQAQELVLLNPDLLEWRIDGFTGVNDINACLEALKALRVKIDQIPLIFTCRIESEGGMQPISQESRLNLIIESMKTGLVDIVDIEICNDKAFIDSIIDAGKAYETRVILSYHDFEKTPPKDFIIEKLAKAQELGADIAKLAAMPKDHEDVLTLLHATVTARKSRLDIPIVTMSMAEEGVVSRIAGGVFGSDITFAIGKSASAPGQIPIGKLRQAMSVLY